MVLLQHPPVSCVPGSTAPWRQCAPGAVDLRLLTSALHLLAAAEESLQCGEERPATAHIGAAICAIGEFRSDLDLHIANPVTAQLDDLCEYVIRVLGMAGRQCRLAPVLEVQGLLHEVRAAWVTLSHV